MKKKYFHQNNANILQPKNITKKCLSNQKISTILTAKPEYQNYQLASTFHQNFMRKELKTASKSSKQIETATGHTAKSTCSYRKRLAYPCISMCGDVGCRY